MGADPRIINHTTSHANMEITPPVIHLNGTNGNDLYNQYDAADDALWEFEKYWQRIDLNARDYYPKGPEYTEKAILHREEMNQKIRDLRDYMYAHLMSISEQNNRKS